MAENGSAGRTLDSGLERLVVLGLWVALGLGITVRVVQFLHRRSLWVDEAFLALNVMSRGYLDLLGSLDWLQMAPPGFLWMERTAFHLFGSGEWAMRIGPLLAAIAVLFLMVPIARRLIHPTAALPVVTSVAFMGTVIRYSNEMKPYGFDVLGTVVLCFLALRVLQDDENSTKLRVALATAPMFSLPTAFLGAGVLAALALRTGRIVLDRQLIVTATIWAIACAIAVLVSGDAEVTAEMAQYWGGTFLFGEGASFAYLRGLLVGFSTENLISLPQAPMVIVGVFFILLGLGFSWMAAQHGRWSIALLGVPFATALLAVVLKQYPFAGRLWMWSLPYLALLTVAGGYRLVPRRRRPQLVFALAFTLLIVGTRGRLAVYFARNPNLFEHSRPLVEQLEERLTDQDAIYVFARALPAWLYYRTDWSSPPPDLRELFALSRPGGPIYVNSWEMLPATEEQLALLHRTDSGGHPVLLGRSSGHRIHQASTVEQAFPTDPDWAPSEVARLQAAAPNGCAWLFQTHVFAPERTSFEEALREAGAVAVDEIGEGPVRAERVCF